MPEFQYLFTPIRIGTMTVPNRIMVTTGFAREWPLARQFVRPAR